MPAVAIFQLKVWKKTSEDSRWILQAEKEIPLRVRQQIEKRLVEGHAYGLILRGDQSWKWARRASFHLKGLRISCQAGLETIQLIDRLAASADASGTLTAEAMKVFFPNDPTRHRVMRLQEALALVGAESIEEPPGSLPHDTHEEDQAGAREVPSQKGHH